MCYIVYFCNDNVSSLSRNRLQIQFFRHVTLGKQVIIADAYKDRSSFVFGVKQSKKSIVH